MSSELGLRILVVEDDLASRTLLREVLHRWGYRTILAVDGVDALERLAEATRTGDIIHLVVLDIQMPRLDGYGVLEHIRSEPAFSSLPVIVISAFSMPEDRNRATAAGTDSFLVKPVDFAKLKAEISWLLEERHRSRP